MRTDWSNDFYDGTERFPEYWSEDQLRKMTEKYEAMPEEFYSTSGLPIVTPDNFDAFMTAHVAESITWDLQERCSGSGRLSAQALKEGLCVGFPVDFRYGWDLGNTTHVKKLRQADDKFRPYITFNAPDCRVWGNFSKQRDPKTLE